jgi:glycosyltransferase involved in cell wall biosynthesis
MKQIEHKEISSKLMKNTLIVIGRLSYPNGSAPCNRVHLYCKALKHQNGFPFIINLHSTFREKPKFNFLARNDGIPFYYAQKTPLWEDNILLRNMNKIKGLFNTIFVIRKIKKKHSLKVLFYATEPWDELFLFVFLKIMKVPIIRDCSEIPSFVIDKKKAIKLHEFFLKLRIKMYHDIIVISDYLNSYYSEIFPKNRIFQIPILVDMDRFKKTGTKKNATKIITYVGYMIGNKDGLQNLIEAMALVVERNKNVKLQLVGSGPDKDMIQLRNKVKALNLCNIISFFGKKNSEEIPAILSQSDLLVLARPDNSQAKAGFPTKLGEYLASAKPVVITTTGEIPKYLKHNESAYLAKPGDIQDFAEKINYALSDKNSQAIGEKGYEIANNNFNYQLYGKKIFNILQN